MKIKVIVEKRRGASGATYCGVRNPVTDRQGRAGINRDITCNRQGAPGG
ncbi:MAG: hypothetical protein MZV63_40940 [Marinilabiliales bacterium]|nr:hypothetical protein [Marinilabiliales bacterium]